MDKKYEEFEKEFEEALEPAKLALKKIMLSEDRMSKHPPYSWKKELQSEHLHKAMRHIMTYLIQRDGQQKDDGEDHLALAITRLCYGALTRSFNVECIGECLTKERGYKYMSNNLMK